MPGGIRRIFGGWNPAHVLGKGYRQTCRRTIGLDISNGRRSGGLAESARGLHDDKIARLAAFFIAAKRPVYLRIGYQFDGGVCMAGIRITPRRHPRAGPAKCWTSRAPEQIWREWYTPLFAFSEEHRNLISALAYVNAHWDAQRMWGRPYASGHWGDSRIQANATLQELWLAEVMKPAWLHGGSGLFEAVGF